MNITYNRREVAESPGFGQSVREMEGGHKGALAGGISLVGYRRFGRQSSMEKKKIKVNRNKLMGAKKKKSGQKAKCFSCTILCLLDLDGSRKGTELPCQYN